MTPRNIAASDAQDLAVGARGHVGEERTEPDVLVELVEFVEKPGLVDLLVPEIRGLRSKQCPATDNLARDLVVGTHDPPGLDLPTGRLHSGPGVIRLSGPVFYCPVSGERR